jgi:hypothetical protein
MKVIDERTVELTAAEDEARDWRDEYLDRYPTPKAAQLALARMQVTDRTDDFIDWLSEGTCRRWGQRVLVRPEWRKAGAH